jgi:hypothetical protein
VCIELVNLIQYDSFWVGHCVLIGLSGESIASVLGYKMEAEVSF